MSLPEAGSGRGPGSWRGLCSFHMHVLFSDEKLGLTLTVALCAVPIEQGALGPLRCPRPRLLVPAAHGGGPLASPVMLAVKVFLSGSLLVVGGEDAGLPPQRLCSFVLTHLKSGVSHSQRHLAAASAGTEVTFLWRA